MRIAHVRTSAVPLALLALLGPLGCTHRTSTVSTDDHTDHAAAAAGSSATPAASAGAQGADLPPSAADARARLTASPRHGEWAMIKAGPSDSVRAWVVYPERKDKAPVVVVVHEIFGLTTWVRSVADAFAANGFIAIAPDLLTGKNVPAGGPDSLNADSAVATIRTLDPKEVSRRMDAAAQYGMTLPAAVPRYGVVGFCWGGATVFQYTAGAPKLGATVVYYGVSPSAEALQSVRAPVLGLYGENDARGDATIPGADSTLKALGRTYELVILPGAGHGFLRAQDGQNGANLSAAKVAWPRTIAWFKKYLGA